MAPSLRSSLALLLVLSLFPTGAIASQTFYLHYSGPGVSVPGSDSHHYLNQSAPTASTATVHGPLSLSVNETGSFPDFTSTALGAALALDRFVTFTMNMSANHVLNNCVDLSAVLFTVTAGNVATTVGSGTVTGVSLPQGSGGGLVGYQPKDIQLEMLLNTQIPAGQSLRLRVSVTNKCASNMSVRLIYDGTQAQSQALFTTSDAAIYGAPGTFGALNPIIRQGPPAFTVARVGVPNWTTDPGQTFFMPALNPADGTFFVGNFFQGDYYHISSCDMVVTCFNPLSKECPDGATPPHLDYFSNIRIPTSQGQIFTPPLSDPLQCGSQPTHGGVDVADVGPLQGSNRVAFISSLASFGTSLYPSVGFLDKSSGVWSIADARSAADVSMDPNGGSQACPFGNCAGFDELEQLVGSGRLIVTEYLGRRVAVLDTTGHVVTSRNDPAAWTDTNNCVFTGTSLPLNVIALPKSVQIDPSSTPPNERFIVNYDNFAEYGHCSYTTGQLCTDDDDCPSGETCAITTTYGRSHAFQEFNYNETTKLITPISAPLFVRSPPNASPQIPSKPCGYGVGNLQGLQAGYDHAGNVWVTRQGAQVDVFLKTNGHRRTETDPTCAYNSAAPTAWGITCPADLEYTFGNSLGVNGGPFEDVAAPGGPTMIFIGQDGPVRRAFLGQDGQGNPTLQAKTIELNLSPDALPKVVAGAGESGQNIDIMRGVVDPGRRTAWFAIQALPIMFPGQSVPPGQNQQPIWMYSIDLDRLGALP